MHKAWLWIGVIIVITLVIGSISFIQHAISPVTDSDESIQPIITANVVDLTKIAAISKFRSCQGHIVVPQDGSEPRSNMKHYFYLKSEYTDLRREVELYAPFDGYVNDIFAGDAGFSDRYAASRDVTISKHKGLAWRGAWGVTLLHIEPRDGLKEGDAVTAGELLGYVSLELIPPYYAFDLVYARMATFPKKVDSWISPYAALDSAFIHMSAAVLAEYGVFGVTTVSDAIIDATTREASPCAYGPDGRSFDNTRDEDWKNDWLGDLEDAIQ